MLDEMANRAKPAIRILLWCWCVLAGGPVFAQTAEGAKPGVARDSAADKTRDRLPRGQKLVLKDGNFQLVSSYERKGERVRYYSVERHDWEELPAAMVDWEATAKEEAKDEKAAAALIKKIHTQEEGQKTIAVMDVDASLPVAPGVFLPQGEGMFLISGKTITSLQQAGSEIRTDRKRALAQVISPVPIIPSKRSIELPGVRATIRVRLAAGSPEFYLREGAPDAEREGAIKKSGRPGESGPEVVLVRATVKGGKRKLEEVRSLFGQEMARDMKTVSLQRWEVAPAVYRFTISEPLPPAEYALAEMLPDGINLFVWDFGVDE